MMALKFKSKPAFLVLSLSDNASELHAREYRKRKSGKRTKAGCLLCKTKRVKCDEARPTCDRCRKSNTSCVYTKPKPLMLEDESFLAGNFSVLSAVTLFPFTTSNVPNGTPTSSLMQHCHTHWASIFHMPRSEEIVSFSKSNPLIRSTILAISSGHLRHISPETVQHRIAEHFQQSIALQDFQKVLNTPREQLGQTGVDALMLSATLLNMVAFALPQSEVATENQAESSWVFSPREDRLGWLALQAGLRPLSLSVTAYIDQTIRFLGPIFFEREKESWEWVGLTHQLDDIPETWIKIFELCDSNSGCDVDSASIGAIFRAPIAMLLRLRKLKPIQSNIFNNLQFLGKKQLEFQALLFKREERALWVCGYWLGLLCRYEEVWWCEKRARRDYRAICLWLKKLHLDERAGVDGEMWREMIEELESVPVGRKEGSTRELAIQNL